jgi:hypothetical protein
MRCGNKTSTRASPSVLGGLLRGHGRQDSAFGSCHCFRRLEGTAGARPDGSSVAGHNLRPRTEEGCRSEYRCDTAVDRRIDVADGGQTAPASSVDRSATHATHTVHQIYCPLTKTWNEPVPLASQRPVRRLAAILAPFHAVDVAARDIRKLRDESSYSCRHSAPHVPQKLRAAIG